MKAYAIIYHLLLFVFLICYQKAVSQLNIEDFSHQQQKIEQVGAYVLSGWAVGNMAVNGGLLLGDNSQTPEKKYFRQMNIYWNIVNLSLGTVGLVRSFDKNPGTKTAKEVLSDQHKIEKIFLFNTALDLAYIGAGLYMMERSTNNESNSDILKGFGKALIFQGSFLFVYDLIMYSFHRKNGKLLENSIKSISFSLSHFSLRFKI